MENTITLEQIKSRTKDFEKFILINGTYEDYQIKRDREWLIRQVELLRYENENLKNACAKLGYQLYQG